MSLTINEEPTFGLLDDPIWTKILLSSRILSKKISIKPPVSFLPKSLAGITDVSLSEKEKALHRLIKAF